MSDTESTQFNPAIIVALGEHLLIGLNSRFSKRRELLTEHRAGEL